jgi:hypothetical protein
MMSGARCCGEKKEGDDDEDEDEDDERDSV